MVVVDALCVSIVDQVIGDFIKDLIYDFDDFDLGFVFHFHSDFSI